MNNNRLVYAFDMDDTLIFSDKEKDKNNLYLKLEPIENHPKMLKFFNMLNKSNQNIFIITGRDTRVQSEISKYFKIPVSHVLCRDFCHNIEEMKLAVNNKHYNILFNEKLIESKIKRLNSLVKKYGYVIFFDDQASDYIKSNKLSSKVAVFKTIK